ncbi:MAG: DegT/DnrJ/EryC1/StrS family aminotransferase [Mongoliitalea sp.]
MIPVTKPFLPPIEEYKAYLDGIWERNWLTNQGPLVKELEEKIKQFLNVPNFLFTGNGTIALQIAIKSLGLKGKIITTPFSYIATTSSILWEGCKPLFVDIDPETLNIDPKEIEKRLDKDIVAILATHVYGNPCDIEAIENLANHAGIPVIYDGAHAFGSKYKGKSLLGYGTISTASFHATKIFHTIEGGGLFTSDPELNQKMYYMRNFGHKGFEDFAEVGINGKNSEFHAAMGLVNLNHFHHITEKRKEIFSWYDNALRSSCLIKPKMQEGGEINYSYYPVLFPNEESLLKAFNSMNEYGISPRRYFYPSLNTISILHDNKNLSRTEDISKRILCLPLYNDLSEREFSEIVKFIIQ